MLSSPLIGSKAWLAGLGFGLAMASAAVAAAPAATPQKVDGPEISMLIRSTIVALHQANLTSNYSVLHDLGDSHFQAAYSQAALSDMFRVFRERGINLAPAVLYDAELDAAPRLTTDGLLRVIGHFPTTPRQITFDLTFRIEAGIWRIDAVNAGTRAVPLAEAPIPTPLAQPQIRPVASVSTDLPMVPGNLRGDAPLRGVVDVGAGQSLQ